MSEYRSVLVTGGAGFIGSCLVRSLLSDARFGGRVLNLDALTYAGNPETLADVEQSHGAKGSGRYRFVHGDICDRVLVESLFSTEKIDAVVHLAAESHVDRSIVSPEAFVRTNVMGTFTLLDVARKAWNGRQDVRFHHVSTDEVFGSLGPEGLFREDTPYDPRSPYSASKAGSDHLVRAYGHTYGLPVTISNCSNNYGPAQFPEKLIPLMILNMLEGKDLPVYGDGMNIRDWLWVEDHARAIADILFLAPAGTTWNVGGEAECTNIALVRLLCRLMAAETGKTADHYEALIRPVPDRPGHDRRYAIDCSRIKRDLGWKQSLNLEEGLRRTLRWYLEHPQWIERVRSGAYREWLQQNYEQRT